MAVAGSLTYDTKIDKKGFEKGLNSLKDSTNTVGGQIKSIVTALGIDKLISATFNLLNNSIDGAISRLDTLNNYPKVMSNLGIAGEDAQKSIDKMSNKLSGLPTTLNEGALAVQRFTSANGDINKSTDYFLALNNAILAGGASVDIQSSALEQLSQAYAKGTPDMMEWRSLMTAMPAQLKQVATAMGYVSTDKLGEDLRNGKVSMDDFMDTIVKLNEEGTNGFQSFEEQARNSTGGIATSITVAKTQVVKGVADIISKIDELLNNEGFGGIGEIISNAGKKAKEVLDMIANNLPEIISIIKKIAPAVLVAVSAFTAYKFALMAIQAIQFVKGIIGTVSAFMSLIPLITSASDAMLLLNMVISLNPIALVVAAIVALIATFVVLWNKCDWFRNFWISLWGKIKSAFETVCNTIVVFFTETIPNAWETFISKLNDLKNNIWNTLVNAWTSIVSFFTNTIPDFIDSVIKWFEQLPYQIGYYLGLVIGNIIQFGINIWNWITVDLPLIIQAVVNWFAELPGRIEEWLVNTIDKIVEWATNVYNTATEWISNTVNSIVNYFKQLPGRIWTWLTNVIDKVVNWGMDMANKGKEAAIKLFNNIIDTIAGLPDQMLNIGKNIVEGLWNGITGMGSWIKNKINDFGKGLLQGMKESLGIQSPSKLFRDEVGRFIPQGVAVGVEADTDSALKAIDNMNDDIISEMNRAVAFETGSINAKASIKSNNSMLNVIQATFNIDGSVDIDGQKAGRLITPHMTKILRTGGVY